MKEEEKIWNREAQERFWQWHNADTNLWHSLFENNQILYKNNIRYEKSVNTKSVREQKWCKNVELEQGTAEIVQPLELFRLIAYK